MIYCVQVKTKVISVSLFVARKQTDHMCGIAYFYTITYPATLIFYHDVPSNIDILYRVKKLTYKAYFNPTVNQIYLF